MANLNNARAKVTHITLRDGVERELSYTLNAMAEMEDRYGSVEAAFKEVETGRMKAIRFMIWAGLLHTEEGLTEQQVGNLIDVQCMENIMQTMQQALGEDMPEQGENLPNA